MKACTRTYWAGAALLILSFGITSLSVFLPVTIHNREELSQVSLGFPFSFLIQNQIGVPIGFPDGPSFPVLRTLISPWENPLQIIWWRFILDVLLILVVLFLIRLIIQALWRRKST
jgi:hypothetical protein